MANGASTATERLEEFREGNAEGLNQAAQSGDPDVPLAPLDAAHVVPVQIGTFRQLLLRDLHLLPKLANPLADRSRKVASHGAMFWPYTTIGLHTIVFITVSSRPILL